MIDCSEEATCFGRFATLEANQKNMADQNKSIIEKLDLIVPAVKENSWWVEKIKWGFVMVTILGVVLGIVGWIKG